MKAIVGESYGPTEALELREVDMPVPGEQEVRVKVITAAINDYDWSSVRGIPKIYRLLFGLRKPKNPIPGMEIAGVIDSLGSKAVEFAVGDAVYGDLSEFGFGAFAEYVCVNEKALVRKPESMSFEEAASISHASMLAYQGLFDAGNLQENQKVLINGAGGGVGSFGLQMAKWHKAHVAGVDTGEKLRQMKSLGFDHVLDYKQVDFTQEKEKYDLILDTKSTRSPWACVRALKPGGQYLTVGGKLGILLQLFVFGPLVSLLTGKKVKVVALKPNKDLAFINQQYEAGKIKCQIDGPYPMEKVPWAIQYFGEGKHHGKVIIAIQPE